MKKLDSKWFSANGYGNAEKKDKEELEKTIRASKHVLDMLKKILEDERKSLNKSSMSDYDIVAWPYYRADKDGQLRQLDKILNLIDLEGN